MDSMSEFVQLRATDGHTLDAYVAQPGTTPLGGLVIVQEIYGVNEHIRSVAERYADDGYVTVAPALFDRFERGIELGDGEQDRERATQLAGKFDLDKGVLDISAAAEWLRGFGLTGVGVVGFCLGGTLAWLCAARLQIEAAVGYYGGKIVNYLGELPKAPVLLHFGELDKHIPAADVDQIAAAHREVKIYRYPAGHAFNRDGGPAYDSIAAIEARRRTLAFLLEHLA
jgi:carboxymethylenebutenolidase